MNKSFFFNIALFFLFSYSVVFGMVSPAISSNKKGDIMELMQLDGQKDKVIAMYQEIFKTFSESNHSVPPTTWNEIKEEINIQLLLDDLAKIYDCHLSDEDIKNLISFRKTAIGQRFSTLQNVLTQEIAKVCSLWGQKLAINIQKKLWDKNIEFDVYDDLDDYNSCEERE